MKKILVLFLAIVLFGCTSTKLEKLGYSKEEAEVICTLESADQAFFSENINDFYKSLFDNSDFKKENLDVYLLFNNLLDGNNVIKYVNDGTITSENFNNIVKLIDCEDFDIDKINDYLKFDGAYDSADVVYLVNDGITTNSDFYKELIKDPMFIENNISLYAKYREEKDNIRDLVEYVNTKNYLTYYEEQNRADVEKYGYEVLVNKFYSLDSDYEPEDLVDVEPGYGRGRLREKAYGAYKAMQDDAKEENIFFYITSPYRSYETQDKLYNGYLANDTQENVDIYSARPGSSEHQLGLALDILSGGYDFGNFEISEASKWLAENAYKYGFILRYPDEKVNITGYKYEAWHYRYLGDLAKDVYESGVTYDEYFEKYVK